MKQRLITAFFGLILFFSIMFFFDTIILNIAVSLVVLLAVYELLSATKIIKHRLLSVVCMIFAGLVPFADLNLPKNTEAIAIFLFAFVLFAILLKQHNNLEFREVATAFFISVIFPLSMETLLLIRNETDTARGIYYVILIFAFAWGSDSGAYFAGRFFGKKKLAPEISPKKTVEGVVGGVFSCYLFVAAVTAVYYFMTAHLTGTAPEINYIPLAIVPVFASLVGVMGDLSASVIKRQCQIKDFGSIMPGHGGVIDRFDSVFFVAPFFFLIISIIKI